VNGFLNYWPQLLAGVIGAAFYYITRYERGAQFTFGEYLRWDLKAWLKGIAGFALLWVVWTYLGGTVEDVVQHLHPALAGFKIPAGNFMIALVLGGCGKPFFDRLPRLVGYFKRGAK